MGWSSKQSHGKGKPIPHLQAISLPIQGGCRVVSGSLKKAGVGKRVATRVSMEVIVIS